MTKSKSQSIPSLFVQHAFTKHQMFSFEDPRCASSCCSSPLMRSSSLDKLVKSYVDIFEVVPVHVYDLRSPTKIKYNLSYAESGWQLGNRIISSNN